MRGNYSQALPAPADTTGRGSSSFSLGAFNPLIGAVGGALMPSVDYKGAYGQYGDALSDLAKKYDPYVEAGTGALSGYGNLAQQLAQDPTKSIDQIMGHYSESPYQEQMQKNLARMMNYNAAQTGMLGSTTSQEQLQNALAGQENQFMQQYLQNALGLQSAGMGGLSDISHMGLSGLGGQTALGEQSAWEQALARMSPSSGEQHLTNTLGGLLGFL